MEIFLVLRIRRSRISFVTNDFIFIAFALNVGNQIYILHVHLIVRDLLDIV